MNRIIILLLATFSISLSNCSVASTSPTTNSSYLAYSNPRTEGLYAKGDTQFVLDKTVTVINAYIIQTINPHLGIAAVPSGLIFAVSTSDSFDPLYDELRISGQFVMTQTYTYETRPDEYGRTKIKTIPVIVPLRDYKNKTYRIVE